MLPYLCIDDRKLSKNEGFCCISQSQHIIAVGFLGSAIGWRLQISLKIEIPWSQPVFASITQILLGMARLRGKD
jgi:hypothetical protein